VIEASNIVFLSILPEKRRTQSPAGAENHNFHLFKALIPNRLFAKPKT
jgi:hypothetical protein